MSTPIHMDEPKRVGPPEKKEKNCRRSPGQMQGKRSCHGLDTLTSNLVPARYHLRSQRPGTGCLAQVTQTHDE